MVKVSDLYDLDIYTIKGRYVGRVADVILNIRLGTISKLQVRAIEPVKKEVGIRGFLTGSFKMMPDNQQEAVNTYKNDVLTVDFDKVQAIGDIMLINSRDIKKVKPKHPPIPDAVTPNSNEDQGRHEKKPRAEKHQ